MSEQKQKKVVLILQARMGSVRLPGKSLIDLAGKPLIVRILDRVKQARLVDDIVLATSTMPENDPLASWNLMKVLQCFEVLRMTSWTGIIRQPESMRLMLF